jgi:catechol 2,3-dioxygenase-like lactoylglutathione lyase family enzyme
VICGAALSTPFHVGIATPDIETSMRELGAALGLRWVALPRPGTSHDTPTGPVPPAARVVYGTEGPLHLELLESGIGTVYDVARGPHLHHVGYWVDDLPAAVADAERDGWAWEVTMLDHPRSPT